MKQELRRREQMPDGTVIGTDQLLNGVKSLLFGTERNMLGSSLLHSWLPWQMGDTTHRPALSGGLWFTGWLGLPVWPG